MLILCCVLSAGAPTWVAKQTRLQKVQKYRFLNRDVLLLDVDSASLDVPFGDCFHTMEKWEVRNKSTGEGAARCRVKVTIDTRFTKNIRAAREQKCAAGVV